MTGAWLLYSVRRMERRQGTIVRRWLAAAFLAGISLAAWTVLDRRGTIELVEVGPGRAEAAAGDGSETVYLIAAKAPEPGRLNSLVTRRTAIPAAIALILVVSLGAIFVLNRRCP